MLFMIISNIFALIFFIWSVAPVELQTSTIQLPDTFSLGADQEMVQFPLKRNLTVSFPEFIRYGDVQGINVLITPLKDPSKCDDFCTEKHLTYENVWLQYQMKMRISYDLNNFQIEPMGETIIPLTKSTPQSFAWKTKAISYNPVYLKNTVFLVFDAINGDEKYEELVFARELTIPVKRVGPFSFPIFRVICSVWFIFSLFWLLLNQKKLVNLFKK